MFANWTEKPFTICITGEAIKPITILIALVILFIGALAISPSVNSASIWSCRDLYWNSTSPCTHTLRGLETNHDLRYHYGNSWNSLQTNLILWPYTTGTYLRYRPQQISTFAKSHSWDSLNCHRIPNKEDLLLLYITKSEDTKGEQCNYTWETTSNYY